MENQSIKQKLPNDPTSLILSLVGTILCCGVIGLVLSIVSFNMAKSAVALYEGNPDSYLESSYSSQKTAKTIAQVAIGLNILGLIGTIIYFVVFGFAMSQGAY